MFWGVTPALDLFSEFKVHSETKFLNVDFNILIIGGTDARHILKTIARRYRHKGSIKLNFYVIESCMETIAKQLLLLITALQPQNTMGLDQKTKVFMELYGNTILRPYTAKYLTDLSHELVRMITDPDYLRQKIDFVNMKIKYKERDYLENLVKFWSAKDEFNIVNIWDRRLRQNLGVRYDSKAGAFDWDLHMRMHQLGGGKQVCDQEYKSFRSNGMAFSWIESEVSRPNRSFVCATMPNGESFAHYGYLGDMETGPFVSFGLECEDEDFLKSTNMKNAYRATDVTERNLKQIFYEIENQQEYEHIRKNNMELGYAIIKQDKIVLDLKTPETSRDFIKDCVKVENVSVNILSIKALEDMRHKPNYDNFFDVIYFAHNYMQKHFDHDIVDKILKEDFLLIAEHPLYVIANRKNDLEEYVKTVKEKTSKMKSNLLKFDLEKDCYLKYVKKN
ncbi:unnamed protein product [Ceutorhynchus assimilis]|uniref:Dynein assembly factor 3, axonemal n=1 Tax=Ceutorhynchus assimilis TaxID=467358 RepID=A0A9N9MSP8_9CUCU|nr:unnamed protein product [Ceutorhynchus assimilis]